MSDELIYAKHRVSGHVGQVPAHYLDHPVLGENLVPVRAGKALFRKVGANEFTTEKPENVEIAEVLTIPDEPDSEGDSGQLEAGENSPEVGTPDLASKHGEPEAPTPATQARKAGKDKA